MGGVTTGAEARKGDRLVLKVEKNREWGPAVDLTVEEGARLNAAPGHASTPLLCVAALRGMRSGSWWAECWTVSVS